MDDGIDQPIEHVRPEAAHYPGYETIFGSKQLAGTGIADMAQGTGLKTIAVQLNRLPIHMGIGGQLAQQPVTLARPGNGGAQPATSQNTDTIRRLRRRALFCQSQFLFRQICPCFPFFRPVPVLRQRRFAQKRDPSHRRRFFVQQRNQDLAITFLSALAGSRKRTIAVLHRPSALVGALTFADDLSRQFQLFVTPPPLLGSP